MTKELTREFLEEAGFVSAYLFYDTWTILRNWYKNNTGRKELRTIKVQNATCPHKFTEDKHYPIISFSMKQKRYSLSLSKFLYAWFNGKVPAGYDVDHIDNNPFNNSLDNLQLLTRYENIHKRYKDNPEGWINQYGKSKNRKI